MYVSSNIVIYIYRYIYIPYICNIPFDIVLYTMWIPENIIQHVMHVCMYAAVCMYVRHEVRHVLALKNVTSYGLKMAMFQPWKSPTPVRPSAKPGDHRASQVFQILDFHQGSHQTHRHLTVVGVHSPAWCGQQRRSRCGQT